MVLRSLLMNYNALLRRLGYVLLFGRCSAFVESQLLRKQTFSAEKPIWRNFFGMFKPIVALTLASMLLKNCSHSVLALQI